MKPYLRADELLQSARRVAMPRAPRLRAPGSTTHVVARCNNREFSFTTAEDLALLVVHLREMVRTYEVTLYAYTLMANHSHLLLQAPAADPLGRPLRWLLTETARAFHQAGGRGGHSWERRYRAVVVEDNLYAFLEHPTCCGDRGLCGPVYPTAEGAEELPWRLRTFRHLERNRSPVPFLAMELSGHGKMGCFGVFLGVTRANEEHVAVFRA